MGNGRPTTLDGFAQSEKIISKKHKVVVKFKKDLTFTDEIFCNPDNIKYWCVQCVIENITENDLEIEIVSE